MVNPALLNRRLEEISFVAFDTETTGLWAPSHRLVELAGVRFRLSGEPESIWQSLINPGCPMPADVIPIHGITDAMVASAPTAERALAEFFAFCGDDTVMIAHNAPFDISFVAAELDRAERALPVNSVLDTVDLFRHHFTALPSYSLESIVKQFKIGTSQEHRALADAELVRMAFQHLRQFWPSAMTMEELVRRCGQYHFSDGRLRDAELPEAFADITLACKEHLALDIVYAASGRPPEPRRIRPSRIFEQRSTMYIRAFCEKSQAERTFRLDRLREFHLAR
jgi:DNA polymerase III subunit epsilon